MSNLSSIKSVPSICVTVRTVFWISYSITVIDDSSWWPPASTGGISVIKETHTSNVIAESLKKPERESDYVKHLFFRPYDVLSIYLMLFTHAE